MKIPNYYPDIWGAILILGSLFTLQFLIAVVLYSLGVEFESGDPGAWVTSILAHGIVFGIYIHITERNYIGLFHLSASSITSTIMLSLVPVTLVIFGAYWWLSDVEYFIASFFSPDPYSYNMLLNLMAGGVISFVMICVIGPLLEEVLFRGMILRGFLAHYSSPAAIIASSTLFAAVHFNMYQIPGAFVLGCFLGWLYYISRSLWPCIIAHALNNISAYIYYMQSPETFLNTAGSYNSVLVNLLTLSVSVYGIYMLNRIFKSNRI